MEGFICIGELQDIISRIVKTSDEANIQKYIFGAVLKQEVSVPVKAGSGSSSLLVGMLSCQCPVEK